MGEGMEVFMVLPVIGRTPQCLQSAWMVLEMQMKRIGALSAQEKHVCHDVIYPV